MQISHTPAMATGFEVPLEMLAACHGRIESQCATLIRLAEHLGRVGADADAREVAAAIRRYFGTAAVHHHADEEQDLFPALLESMAGSDAVCIRQLTERLRAEHRHLEAMWAKVDAALQAVEGGNAGVLDPAAAREFSAAYAAHMAVEQTELLPMAAHLLGDVALDAIGRAMRERRGVALPGSD